jgi:hypothetical protein
VYHDCLPAGTYEIIYETIERVIQSDRIREEEELSRQEQLKLKYASICVTGGGGADVISEMLVTSPDSGGHDDVFFIREGYDANSTLDCVCQHVLCDSQALRDTLFQRISTSINTYQTERGAAEERIGNDLDSLQVVSTTDHNSYSHTSPLSLNSEATEVGISLGSNCEAAVQGVANKLRLSKAENYQTCPFDIGLFNYNGVVECLRDKFKYFTDSRYLTTIEIQDTFGHYKKGVKVIYNSKYRFIFNHESWQEFSANDFFYFKKRYNRRIDHFFEYINSAIFRGSTINFLVATTVDAEEQMPRLIDAISTTFEGLRFRFSLFIVRSYIAELEAGLVNLTVADIIY